MDTGMHTSSRDRLVRTRVPNIVGRRWQTALINNYSLKANNCFSINTQVIISIEEKKKKF